MVSFEDISIASNKSEDLPSAEDTDEEEADPPPLEDEEKKAFLTAIDRAGGFDVKPDTILARDTKFYGKKNSKRKQQFRNLFDKWKAKALVGKLQAVRNKLFSDASSPLTSPRRHRRTAASEEKKAAATPDSKKKATPISKKIAPRTTDSSKQRTMSDDNRVYDPFSYDSDDEEASEYVLCIRRPAKVLSPHSSLFRSQRRFTTSPSNTLGKTLIGLLRCLIVTISSALG